MKKFLSLPIIIALCMFIRIDSVWAKGGIIIDLDFCLVSFSCGSGSGDYTELGDGVCPCTVNTKPADYCTPPSGQIFSHWACSGNNVEAESPVTSTSGYVNCTAQYGTPVTCSSGYYLPANSTRCAACPSGAICPGGTFVEKAVDQGKYSYTVTYSCGSGGGDAPANGYANNGEPFKPAVSECTPPSGKAFDGWLISGTNTVMQPGVHFTYTYSSNKTLTAQYDDPKFSLTTTSLNANDTFQFSLSAQGTFYVDCGAGGTLSGTGASGTTIIISDTMGMGVYTCTYSTAGTKTIQFGGIATGYPSIGRSVFSVAVAGSATLVQSLSGDLSAIFPDLGSAGTPKFGQAFKGCTNLTSIPETLFSNITTGASAMFQQTFDGCTGLTSIPAGLFSNITTGATTMFQQTFSGCTNITGFIPPSTFAGLIENGSPTANNMWRNTFNGTQLVTECPSNAPQYITGYEGEDTSTYTKWNGYVSCKSQVTCPSGYYLPANSSTCTTCPSGRICPGGTFALGAESDQGKYDYTITYSCGSGGGDAPAVGYADNGESFTTATNTCTPQTGYKFSKWNCGGTNVNAGSAFTVNANTTCTAQYRQLYTITYSCGTGSGDAPTVGYADNGESFTTATNTCTPQTGYKFSKWNCGGTDVNAGSAFTVNANTTCTAQYRQLYTITYSCGTGSGDAPAVGYADNGESFTTATNTCTPQTGYKFSKWNCGGTNVNAGSAFTVNANTTCTAQYVPLYTVTYSCGTGSGDAPANGYVSTGESFVPAANTCTPPSGKAFDGWLISGTNTVMQPGVHFTYTYSSNKTLTAQYDDPKFSLTTTSLNANDTFQFSLSAKGTFYVDCGAGGTLSGTGASGTTITKSNTTYYTYLCTYSTGGTKTIRFGGTAIAYNTGSTTIKFSDSANKVSSISGNLSTIFPYLGSGSGQQPSFYGTFQNCTGLTSIPVSLFSGYTTGVMFQYTFSGCTGLTSIPENLFSGITTGTNYMFSSTFSGCTGLTSIPAGLFSGITTGASYMFLFTFYGCTGLTSIPANLFSRITTVADFMFSYTFQGCTGLTSIPSGLFSNITTGATSLFQGIFYGCTGLTSIPENLFKNVTTEGSQMFYETFSGCSNLAGYIPPSTFAGLIANGHPTANAMWHSTFYNTKLVTECPSGTTQYITGYEGTNASTTWNRKVSCEPSNALNVTYSCGSGGGTAPASTTATYNSSFTPASNTCITPSGYSGFSGWLVSGTSDVKPASTAFTWDYVSDKTLTAQWISVVNMTFDGGSPMSCNFGSTFVPPTPEPRPGYIFTGWKVKPSCVAQIQNLDRSIDGTTCGYQNDSTGANGANSYNTSNYGITTDNTWAVEFSYGTVWGKAICINTSGTQYVASTPTLGSSGQYCWCQATGFTASGNDYTSGPRCTTTASSSWVFYGGAGSAANCAHDCASSCAYRVLYPAAFRTPVFDAVGQ